LFLFMRSIELWSALIRAARFEGLLRVPTPGAKSCEAPKARSRNGGARRDRTDDLMLAKHALYQLSYGPSCALRASEGRPSDSKGRQGEPDRARLPKTWRRKMVGPGRLELPTLRLSGVRSNHLSYGPSGSKAARMVESDASGSRSHHRSSARCAGDR
jgi:hypothetical protein